MKLSAIGLLVATVGFLATGVAQAEWRDPKAAKPADVDPCVAAYGPGFHTVPGTSVCLKVSGYVSTTMGFSSNGRSHNPAP